jgi:Domain of unknown function (DUF4224)
MATNDHICLTAAEISQLTGKLRPSAQLKALRFMAIDHKRRPDGSIMVLRAKVVPPCDDADTADKFAKRTEPNWN